MLSAVAEDRSGGNLIIYFSVADIQEAFEALVKPTSQLQMVVKP